MVRIITDSSTLYSVKQGEALGIDVSMLSVTINNKTYREFEEINTKDFIDIINQGHIPTSSQPSIGEVLELYNKYPQDDLLNVTIADGLSGTYQTALSAAEMAHRPERITVFNSRTLCGPHRYLVNKALELAKGGKAVKAIVAELEKLIATSKSFLIPQDFDYLIPFEISNAPMRREIFRLIEVEGMRRSRSLRRLSEARIRRKRSAASKH